MDVYHFRPFYRLPEINESITSAASDIAGNSSEYVSCSQDRESRELYHFSRSRIQSRQIDFISNNVLLSAGGIIELVFTITRARKTEDCFAEKYQFSWRLSETYPASDHHSEPYRD